MNWFRIGAGPGRIFPPVESGEGGFLSLVTVGIVIVSVVLLWAAGCLLFVVELVGAMFVLACLVVAPFLVVKIIVEAYRRRWPLG